MAEGHNLADGLIHRRKVHRTKYFLASTTDQNGRVALEVGSHVPIALISRASGLSSFIRTS
jgi:hypothetical protein